MFAFHSGGKKYALVEASPLLALMQMVDGMGGIDSTNYRTFVSLACQAFNVLRRSAGLVLNLLHLMSGKCVTEKGGELVNFFVYLSRLTFLFTCRRWH